MVRGKTVGNRIAAFAFKPVIVKSVDNIDGEEA